VFNEENHISFGVLNAVIWKLYEKGYHLAAKLIEDERDKGAIMAGDKGLDKQIERMKLYAEVETRHARLSLKDGQAYSVINEINELPTLGKVYFIFIANPDKLRRIETVKELYNRVAASYLQTFEGFRSELILSPDNLGQIRSAFSTVERCVRFIKGDKPDIFNPELVKEAGVKHKRSTEEFGNNVIGL